MSDLRLLTRTEALLPPWNGSGPAALGILFVAMIALSAAWWWHFRKSGDEKTLLRVSEDLITLGSALVVGLVVLYATVAIGLVFGIQPSPALVSLAVMITLMIQCLLAAPRAGAGRAAALSLVALLLIAPLSVWFAGQFFDLTWDGQDYHQEAVIQIHEGWNPVREPGTAEVHEGYHPLYNPGSANQAWVRHYPKAPWYQAAAIISVTDRVETGKAPNVILLVASYLFVFALVLVAAPSLARCAPFIAAGIALNPISATQWASYHVDGALASAVITLLSGAAYGYARPQLWLVCFMTSVSAAVILIGTKFTGVMYAPLFLIAVAPFVLLGARTRRQRMGAIAAAVLAVIIGVCVVGYNPYVTNFRDKGHPLYPIAGADGYDVIQYQAEESFLRQPWASRMLLSHFSATGNVIAPKAPLHLRSSELGFLGDAGTRHGGFGPLYSAILVLSLALMPMAWRTVSRLDRPIKCASVWAFSVVLMSVAVNSAAWWARFVPQMYLLSALIILVAFLRTASNARVARVLATAGFVLLVANAGVVVGANAASQAIGTEQVLHVSSQLKNLAAEGRILQVDSSSDRAGRRRLDEARVPYRLTDLHGRGEHLTGTITRVELR